MRVNSAKEYHYNQQQLSAALEKVGLKKGDIVFSHSNIGFFGFPEGERSSQNMFNTVLNAFMDVLGADGTLVVPTFTYSFPQGKFFDPKHSASDCGIFPEMLRQLPHALRSEDPCASIAAIGRHAKDLTENASENTYAEGSFFDRLYKNKGVICNLNMDAGSTFIHYVERALQVPYRFDKTFEGSIIKGGQEKPMCSTIWVRYLIEGTEPDFAPFDALSKSQGMWRFEKVGRGNLGLITAENTFQLIKKTLSSRPAFLTMADAWSTLPEIFTSKGLL